MDNNKEISNPLADFCDRHKISRRDLSDAAGGAGTGASKSQIQRLIKEQLTDDERGKLRLVLAKNLPQFLFQRGFSTVQINEELTKIFDKGEYQPMITERIKLPAVVQKNFGLTADPFGIKLRDTNDVFISDDLHAIFDNVMDAAKFQGFTGVTGDIGAGKSVLKMLVEATAEKDSEIELIPIENFDMSKLSASSIARAILEHYDYGKIPVDGSSRTRAVKQLLIERTKNVQTALIFDEAHHLDVQTIITLKNFHELMHGFRYLLGIVLFGQPSLKTTLAKAREINERLEILEMPKFSDSAIEYLKHRFALVGGDAGKIFDGDALQLIAENSETPLQLGNITNKAMIVVSGEPYQQKTVSGSLLRADKQFAGFKFNRKTAKFKAVG